MVTAAAALFAYNTFGNNNFFNNQKPAIINIFNS